MKLAKSKIDIGLCTNNRDSLLRFWQTNVGLKLDQVLPVRRGQIQYRHDALGSVVKINYFADELLRAPSSGYRELLIARKNITGPEQLIDPDGNCVTLLPLGSKGITQIGVRLTVRDMDAHRDFYKRALGLEEQRQTVGTAFHAGETLIMLEEQRGTAIDAPFRATGWRYITFQVFNVDEVHAEIVAAGGREGLAPTTLGTTARISMILDPDGNCIELSQRASIVGPLD